MKQKKLYTNQGINYIGTIKVSVIANNKVYSSHFYHNSGKEPLFQFICNCLKGSLVENQRPKFIGLFQDSTPRLIGNNKVKYNTTSNVSSEDDSATISLKFLIPLSWVVPSSVEQEYKYKNINLLKLYNDGDSCCAEVSIPEGLNIELPAGYKTKPQSVNLLIVWKMEFSSN